MKNQLIDLALFFASSPNYRFVDVDKLEYDVGGSRFVIRRLRKYAKYEIVIQAVNSFGEGPLSIPSIGQTQEDGKKRPSVIAAMTILRINYCLL